MEYVEAGRGRSSQVIQRRPPRIHNHLWEDPDPAVPSLQNYSQQDEEEAVLRRCPSANPPILTQPAYLRVEPPAWESQIIHIGNGTIAMGQSTEEFENTSRVSLCYQLFHYSLSSRHAKTPAVRALAVAPKKLDMCLSRYAIPTGLLMNVPLNMPEDAVEACKDFRIFLDWWIEKVDLRADEIIERRARDRVLEMRDDIPSW
ncbi:hypothetical protein F5Y12DRAFT_791582 [Xylaria sp. FL1777]|nr:hypothetical protein F5Y12DRAFT_791582 [Xylaria sp. FL1777]